MGYEADTDVQGRNQRKLSGVAEVIFGNDYDVIYVQSTTTRLFCYDQLTNSCEGTFFIVGAHGRPQGAKIIICLPWNLGYEPNMSRKPEVNGLIPILTELILAMTVYFPI